MRAQSAHNAASRGDVSLLTELIGQPPDKQVLQTICSVKMWYKLVGCCTNHPPHHDLSHTRCARRC
jgi:hypothetical protein